MAKEHKFVVRHQRKQQLILRALDRRDRTGETAHETAAVEDMIARLELLLGGRQRRRLLGASVKAQGTSPTEI